MKLLPLPMTASVVTVLIFLACVAGCSSQVAPAGTAASVPSTPQVPAKTHATLEPEQMVLQISDLPGNYTLITSGERNASKVQSWMHNAGWKKGYAVLFQKNESGSSAHPAIWHYVYQFPVENASRVVSLQVDGLMIYDAQDERNQNTTFLELASPGIGDTSRAVSIADKNDPEIMNMIAFSKYDVYEELWCNATPADYENLKKVAAIAAAKIE